MPSPKHSSAKRKNGPPVAGRKKNLFLANLEGLPRAPRFSSHEWADYLELLCLVNVDGQLSKADALDRIRPRVDDLREGGEGVSNQNGQGPPQTSGDQSTTGGPDTSPGQATDAWSTQAHELYKHLAFRSRVFGNFYPFVVNAKQDELSTKVATDLEQKFYISLLLSANLTYIGPKHHQLTSSFEVLSLEVLKRFLPNGAEAHIFGTSPLLPKRYKGTLWKKINQLADDLKERVIAMETDFPPTDVGDGGLDLVGWVPCGDGLNSMLSVFGQSACTDEWKRKQATSTPEAWRRKLTFAACPYNMVFIPFCLRNADGSWHVGSTIQSIMIDRLRFTYFLRDKMDMFQKLPSHEMVDEILKLKEDIV